MTGSAPGVDEFLPLTSTVFHILLSLADQERHGYGIMQEVEAMTRGQIRMGPGTLYGAIKRMLAANLIVESDERPDPGYDDERRRYYRLTALGQRVLGAEAQRLSHLVDVAQRKRIVGSQEMG
ncbi:MAG TPA: PadR family transcriptional regulator [Anaerolineae bacterium]|nr:PadR family transcriptional regulator [Anaerolineae bacterium]